MVHLDPVPWWKGDFGPLEARPLLSGRLSKGLGCPPLRRPFPKGTGRQPPQMKAPSYWAVHKEAPSWDPIWNAEVQSQDHGGSCSRSRGSCSGRFCLSQTTGSSFSGGSDREQSILPSSQLQHKPCIPGPPLQPSPQSGNHPQEPWGPLKIIALGPDRLLLGVGSRSPSWGVNIYPEKKPLNFIYK